MLASCLASCLRHSISKLTLNKTGSSWLLFAYSLEKVFCSHACTFSSYFNFPLRNPVGLCQVIVAHSIVMATSHTHLWLPLNFQAPFNTDIHWRCVKLIYESQSLSVNIPAG